MSINECKECQGKQICCRMQNASLRCAIASLRQNLFDGKFVFITLEAIYNLLDVYSCLPGKCLLKRVQWVHDNIDKGYMLSENEEIKVKMLILELEEFLNDSNS